jgi:hypothetical protein
MSEIPANNNAEDLQNENEFLKMKLMLERGAKFGTCNDPGELSPAIENLFLKNIMAFEEKMDGCKTIRIFDKIGRPSHFKPESEIQDADLSKALENILQYLETNHIVLHVVSPNVPERELYRFIIEELFEEEMNDMGMDGWDTVFIYDEFHPDVKYDNTRMALNDCISQILNNTHLKFMGHYRQQGLKLNNHYPITEETFKTIVNRYKSSFENTEILELKDTGCQINGNDCEVNGLYKLKAMVGREPIEWEGSWCVRLDKEPEFGHWYINEVQISGINF